MSELAPCVCDWHEFGSIDIIHGRVCLICSSLVSGMCVRVQLFKTLVTSCYASFRFLAFLVSGGAWPLNFKNLAHM